jgi:hypothetical protein
MECSSCSVTVVEVEWMLWPSVWVVVEWTLVVVMTLLEVRRMFRVVMWREVWMRGGWEGGWSAMAV